MKGGKIALAVGSLALVLVAAASISAQHPIRRAGHHTEYYQQSVQHAGDCCGGTVDYGGDACCDPCCRPCLCLPNPCVVFDRIGTALHGLRELFRCRCCCPHTIIRPSRCCGVVEEEMPYLNHPYTPPAPPQQEADPAPTPAAELDSSTYRVPSKYQAIGQNGTSRIRYRAVVTEPRPAATPRRQAASARQVRQTSYEEPAKVAPVNPRPIKQSAGGSVRIVKGASENPLR